MEDREIIALFWNRAETAIQACREQYGGYCRAIAARILKSPEDTEECLSDTWLGAWNAIPPQKPGCLRVFLGRITRNLALDRYAYHHAEKRGSGFTAVLDELAECVSGSSLEEDFDAALLGEAISRYLASCKAETRQVFLRRYWYGERVDALARQLSATPNGTAQRLRRLRASLRRALEQEGVRL